MVYAIAAAILFGAAIPLCKWLGIDWPEVLLAGALYLSCGVGLLLLRSVVKRGDPIKRSDLPYLSGVVFFGGIAAPVALLYGLKFTTGYAGALLVNLEAVFTTLLAVTIFRAKLSLRDLAAVIIITLAAGTVSLGSTQDKLASHPFFGAILVALACLGWGLDNNFTQRISQRDPLQIAGVKGLIAGIVNLTIGLSIGQRPPVDAKNLIVAALVGLFSYGASIALFILALRRLGSAKTSALFALAPVTGVVTAWAMLGERPNWLAIAGGAAMCVTVAWMALFHGDEIDGAAPEKQGA